jgi:predicted membrane protein
MSAHHIMLNNAPAVTFTGGTSAILFWGLHVSDVAVICSSLATILGVVLQFYVMLHRIRIMERQQVAQTITSAGDRAKTDEADVKLTLVAQRVGDVAQDVQTMTSQATLDASSARGPETQKH